MSLESISITNSATQPKRLELDPRFNFVSGLNGSGKTSLWMLSTFCPAQDLLQQIVVGVYHGRKG